MGPFFAAVAELFPISQCYTGLSVGYNIGVALFGGTAPLVVTFLIEWSGNVLAPAFYLSFCATLSLAITFPIRNRAPAQAASAEAARQEALISLDPWSNKRRRRARACDTIIQAMPTPRTVSWTLLPLQLLLATLTWLVWPNLTQAVDYGNEVTVEIEPRHAVATSLLSGRRAILLDAHETVISSGASGINAVVVTSRRLLGFSSRTLSWSETDRDLNEKVLERRLLPTFSVVRTDKHLYGFRGANGIWLDEALGVRETVKRTQTTDYGAVFVTNERLVGFASLLGDFSSKALGVHERITRLDNEKGLIIVTTSTRTLVFGSRLSGWEEFE